MWLSTAFGMVAEKLLVIKLLFPTLTNNEVVKEDSLSWNLLLQKKKKGLTEWSARTLKLTFFLSVDEWTCRIKSLAELYLLSKGVNLRHWIFPLGRLEPVHQHRDIRTLNRPAPSEDHFSLVLMNYALLFSRCWFVNSLDIYRSRKNGSSFWVSAYRIIGFISVWIVRTPKDLNERFHLNESTLISSCERGFVS